MNIAIYFPFSLSIEKNNDLQKFIVETSFLMMQRHSEHKFTLITDNESAKETYSLSSIETLVLKPLSNNPFLKRIWFDLKLPAILKKLNADLFISFDNVCSSKAFLPQSILILDLNKTKKIYIKKAQLLLVTNKLIKGELIEEYGIAQKRVTVLYPSANKIFEPINEKEKTSIKNKYSDNKEFFLFSGFFSKQEDLIPLLKSFSHFKKRQQSRFNLLLTLPINSFFERSLANYKYRDDVKFIDTNDIQEQALITASAYAVVLPSHNDSIRTALNSMRSGVPVIALKNSIVSEVAEGVALYAETEATKDIGEKMIQVYTDENYRFSLIEKGKQLAEAYTNERAAEILWQSILEALT